MLTDLNDIGKLQDGMKKLADANEKFCAVWQSAYTPTIDAALVVEQINRLADMKQRLSLLLPGLTGP